MKNHFKTLFFAALAALFFSGFVLAASTTGVPEQAVQDNPTDRGIRTIPRENIVPIEVTFSPKTGIEEYTIEKIIVLQKNQNAWKLAAPGNLKKGNTNLINTPSSDRSFSTLGRISIAFTVDGSARILVKYKDEGQNTVWKIADSQKSKILTFPTDFKEPEEDAQKTDKAYPLFRIPKGTLAPGAYSTEITRFPAIGWAFTYELAKITAGIKPLVYDKQIFDLVAQAIATELRKTKDNPPADTIETMSVGNIFGNKEIGKGKNVFYQARVNEEHLLQEEGQRQEIRWSGLGKPTARDSATYLPVPNGDYQIILHEKQITEEQETPQYGRDYAFSSMPIHVAGYAKQVGQYLIKIGEKFQFQYYEFILLETGAGTAKIKVMQIATKGKVSPDRLNAEKPIRFGNSILLPGEDKTISTINTGTVYPTDSDQFENKPMLQDKRIKIRFALSKFYVSSIKDQTVKEQYQNEENKYAVLTVVQTDALQGRITEVPAEFRGTARPPARTGVPSTTPPATTTANLGACRFRTTASSSVLMKEPQVDKVRQTEQWVYQYVTFYDGTCKTQCSPTERQGVQIPIDTRPGQTNPRQKCTGGSVCCYTLDKTGIDKDRTDNNEVWTEFIKRSRLCESKKGEKCTGYKYKKGDRDYNICFWNPTRPSRCEMNSEARKQMERDKKLIEARDDSPNHDTLYRQITEALDAQCNSLNSPVQEKCEKPFKYPINTAPYEQKIEKPCTYIQPEGTCSAIDTNLAYVRPAGRANS